MPFDRRRGKRRLVVDQGNTPSWVDSLEVGKISNLEDKEGFLLDAELFSPFVFEGFLLYAELFSPLPVSSPA